MEKRTREILALVLLVVLGLFAAGAMAWYVVAGHGWNQAATRIDDMVGSMDGYTVIVFESNAKKTDRDRHDKKRPVSAARVVKSYEEKDAKVLRIPSWYAKSHDDPFILKRGNKRIGLFDLPGEYRRNRGYLRSQVRYLQKHSVDVIVAVTWSKSWTKAKLDGIDLLIVMRDAGIIENGEVRNAALCVDSPETGEVQAVIISPSGVLTSRTVREL